MPKGSAIFAWDSDAETRMDRPEQTVTRRDGVVSRQPMAVFGTRGVPRRGIIEIRDHEQRNLLAFPHSTAPRYRLEELVRLGGLNPYGQHQALCRLFDLPPKELRRDKPTPSVPIACRRTGWYATLILYACVPTRQKRTVVRCGSSSRKASPQFEEGDVLDFKLRANAVILSKRNATRGENRSGPDSAIRTDGR